MKQVLLIVFIQFLTVSATAQTPVNEAQARQMTEQVNKAAQAMKTLQCTFRQTKTLRILKNKMVAKGRMCYSQPSQLRWEYTSPYQYVFIVNGNKVLMKNSKRTDVIDANKNKVFKQITSIMMSSVTGKCLTDQQNFKTQMSTSGTSWIARLTPVKKELRQLFSQLLITFDTKRMVAVRVEMIEKGGDNTVIELLDPIKNASVNGNEYKID
ncbi:MULTISPECIES: outer membrane lipoprotein carrier protein LolA [Hoylesella]|jgi:outer membrane lipoprotein carrier protein lolA|uniref:outer membrane lipoprotein carrier protein LolA n=1 Tax=Hoylesella TaxID=2974257 RepID=UPI00288C087D|nr:MULTISPECIES: outer membrane lipoprotein carrier protein LolA [Hoylesella]